MKEKASRHLDPTVYLDRFVRIQDSSGKWVFDLAPPYSEPTSKLLLIEVQGTKIKVQLKNPPKTKTPEVVDEEVATILRQFYHDEDGDELAILLRSRPALKASDLPSQDLQYLVGKFLIYFFRLM